MYEQTVYLSERSHIGHGAILHGTVLGKQVIDEDACEYNMDWEETNKLR